MTAYDPTPTNYFTLKSTSNISLDRLMHHSTHRQIAAVVESHFGNLVTGKLVFIAIIWRKLRQPARYFGTQITYPVFWIQGRWSDRRKLLVIQTNRKPAMVAKYSNVIQVTLF